MAELFFLEAAREAARRRSVRPPRRRWSARYFRLGQYIGLVVLAAGLAILFAATWLGPHVNAISSAPAAAAASTVGAAGFGLCARARQPNCVVDGDTFHAAGLIIRIADIDTPETHPARCPTEQRLGDRATTRLRDLLNLGAFELVSIDRDQDKYGRSLRLVTRNGISLGDTLVAEGLARVWDGARHSWCS